MVKITPAQEMGMLELNRVEGGSIWLLPGAIYAIEQDAPQYSWETGASRPSTIRTAGEVHMVKETPEEIVEVLRALIEQERLSEMPRDPRDDIYGLQQRLESYPLEADEGDDLKEGRDE